MPRGPLLERFSVDAMWEYFRTTWIDEKGYEHLAVLQRPIATLQAPELVRMLVDEARILRCLVHPNVVRLFDTGEEDGIPWQLLEWTEGKTLAAVMRASVDKRIELPLELAAWIVAGVLRGLDHAQYAPGPSGPPLGVVHRDVRPDNVRLGWDGSVRLGGFSVAHAVLEQRQETPAGIIKGRFPWMSPEQVIGAALDGKSDVFACGVLLYELATGIRPFRGNTDFEILQNIRECRPQSARELKPSLPIAFESTLSRALQRQPAARIGAAALASLLEEWSDAQPEPGGPRALTRYLRSLFDPESLER